VVSGAGNIRVQSEFYFPVVEVFHCFCWGGEDYTSFACPPWDGSYWFRGDLSELGVECGGCSVDTEHDGACTLGVLSAPVVPGPCVHSQGLFFFSGSSLASAGIGVDAASSGNMNPI
jgi:hypothetical protein